MPSCAAWLSWKCQIAPGTAREQVRVARALGSLPVIRAGFAAARLSYAKVRALTRIATAETEQDLAEMATPMTAAQLERFARAHRRVSAAEDGQVRSLSKLTWHFADDMAFAFKGCVPPDQGAVVLQAIRAALGDLEHPHEHEDGVSAALLARGDDPPEPPGCVSAETQPGSSGRPAPAVAPLPRWHPAYPMRCHIEDGLAISPAAAQLIGCNAALSWMLHDRQGNVLDVGRCTRKISAALRRAVRERDRYHCRFPGCESRRTDAHHVVYWSNGGQTRLSGLISLCKRHHALVHSKNFIIATVTDGFAFYTPQGTLIPPSPPLPPPSGDITSRHDAAITPTTIIPPHSGERLDLHLAIWICFANARNNAERRQPEHQAQAQCA